MNAFVRTVVYGMALLGMFLCGGLITLLMLLGDDEARRRAQRAVLLTPREKRVLAAAEQRPPEPPLVEIRRDERREEIIEQIAEQANQNQVRELVLELKQQRDFLDDREAYLDKREHDLELARTDLIRMRSQLDERERALTERIRRAEQQRQAWAEARLREGAYVQAVNAVEQENLQRLVKTYASRKADEAWALLRELETDLVAKLLYFMEPRAAADILVEAVRDADYPLVAKELQERLLRIDPRARTRSQRQRLADLFNFMPPAAIHGYLTGMTAEEVAEILASMREPARVGALLTYLREQADPREPEIQRRLIEGGRKEAAP